MVGLPRFTLLQTAPRRPEKVKYEMLGITPQLLRDLSEVSNEYRDNFDFGCVEVDDEGRVLRYNRYESELSGVSPEKAIGRNFFRELAPCTNNRLVFGRFKEGIAAGSLDAEVTYAFTYKMRPTLVKIRLYRDPATKTNWILVMRVGVSK